jgi:hypothetical protein
VGIPAGLAADAAFATLLLGLLRRCGRLPEPLRAEVRIIAAILLTGSVAALGWSPLQEPALAVPLLLAAGRGWRLLGAEDLE